MIKCNNTINEFLRNPEIPSDLSLLDLIEHMRDVIVRNMDNPNIQEEVQPVDFNTMYIVLYFSKRSIQESIQQPLPINGVMLRSPSGTINKFALGPQVYPDLTEAFGIDRVEGHVVVHRKETSYIYIDLEGSDKLTTYASLDFLSEAIMLGNLNPTEFFNVEAGYSPRRTVMKKDHKTIASIAKRLVALNALPQAVILRNPSIISELTEYRTFIGELIIIVGDFISALYVKGKYDITSMVPGSHFDVKECLAFVRENQYRSINDVVDDSEVLNDIGPLQCMLGAMGVNILDLLDQQFVEVSSENISYHPYQPRTQNNDDTPPSAPKPNYS